MQCNGNFHALWYNQFVASSFGVLPRAQSDIDVIYVVKCGNSDCLCFYNLGDIMSSEEEELKEGVGGGGAH